MDYYHNITKLSMAQHSLDTNTYSCNFSHHVLKSYQQFIYIKQYIMEQQAI